MRSILILLIITLLVLQHKLWLGDGNLIQWVQLEKKLKAQHLKNNLLAERNKALEADIKELKSGDQALEEQARYELGMIKENEIYYQFIDAGRLVFILNRERKYLYKLRINYFTSFLAGQNLHKT